jgi:hypothetical protein
MKKVVEMDYSYLVEVEVEGVKILNIEVQLRGTMVLRTTGDWDKVDMFTSVLKTLSVESNGSDVIIHVTDGDKTIDGEVGQ